MKTLVYSENSKNIPANVSHLQPRRWNGKLFLLVPFSSSTLAYCVIESNSFFCAENACVCSKNLLESFIHTHTQSFRTINFLKYHRYDRFKPSAARLVQKPEYIKISILKWLFFVLSLTEIFLLCSSSSACEAHFWFNFWHLNIKRN